MTDVTTRLALPYILPSQAQKHVTHNEALQRLDAASQLVVEASLASPPDTPVTDACYWVLAGSTGAFEGAAGQLAIRQDESWTFLTPGTGWLAYFRTTQRMMTFSGTAWQELALPDTGRLSQLGVNATADATNRLAVASPAVLFNNAGTDIRMTLNKAGSAQTATLLYQSNWQGRAEMGLAGSDEFAIKVSGDGSSWTTALQISGDGHVRRPQRPMALARQTASPVTVTNGMMTGFDVLSISQGGMALGAASGSGIGNTLKFPIAGIYLLSLALRVTSATDYTFWLRDSDQRQFLPIIVGTTTVSHDHAKTLIVSLSANSEVQMLHTGSATLDGGTGGLVLTGVLLS